MAGALQNSAVNKTFALILSEDAKILPFETLLTDAARTVVLASGTIMSQVASTKKWVPWLNANLADTTGLQYPLGVYIGPDVTAAALAAGDVTEAPILVGDAVLDINLLVFDKGSTGAGTANTIDVIPTVPTSLALRGEAILNMKGIFVTGTQAADLPEN